MNLFNQKFLHKIFLFFFYLVEFFNDDLGFNIRRKYCVRVISLEQFNTFESLLEQHLSHALPTVKSIEFGCQILKQFYSEDNESEKYQKLAIQVERVSAVVNESIASCQ